MDSQELTAIIIVIGIVAAFLYRRRQDRGKVGCGACGKSSACRPTKLPATPDKNSSSCG